MIPLIYGFIFCMWILVLAGGAVAIVVLGPISFPGLGDLDGPVSSIVKAAAAIGLVVLWILILSKIKNAIFHRRIGA